MTKPTGSRHCCETVAWPTTRLPIECYLFRTVGGCYVDSFRFSSKILTQLLLLRWRYNPGWVLASFTIRLQASRSLALSLHSFILVFLRSVDTSSSHLIFGLPLRLVACSFPCIFFGIAAPCILSIWLSHYLITYLLILRSPQIRWAGLKLHQFGSDPFRILQFARL